MRVAIVSARTRQISYGESDCVRVDGMYYSVKFDDRDRNELIPIVYISSVDKAIEYLDLMVSFIERKKQLDEEEYKALTSFDRGIK